MSASDRAPDPTPLVRGKRLRSETRRLGARLAHAALARAVAEQRLSQHFLAGVLGVDQAWVQDVLAGRAAASLGDAFVLPRSLRRALGLALLLSAENDNHG